MFIDLLRKRRSVRQFQDKAVDQEDVATLVEAMLRAPSSRNTSPWKFVVVQEKTTIEALAKTKEHGSAFLGSAPLVIAVCADPKRCDVWIEDCSIATVFLHLAAADLGLGSCWVQVRLREHDAQKSAASYVAETLSLSEGLEVEALIAIGHPLQESTGHPDSTLLKDRVSYQGFGEKG